LLANNNTRRKFRKDSLCPCDSGLKYGDCCELRGIKYSYDRENNLVKTLPINPQMEESFLGAIDSIKQIFKREAVNDDPLFLEGLLYSDEERREKSTEILRYAFGVPEEDLYASKKLGFIINKENRKHASLKDINAWNLAKKEYRNIESGKIKKEVDPLVYYFEELEDWVVRLIYLYALLHFKSEGEFKENLNLYKSIDIKSYILFCLTKNLKSLKASRALTTSNFNEDAFSLIRSMYENYLQITTAVHKPTQLLDELRAKVGLHEETHYLEKDIIIEKSTGKAIKILNNKQRAALDKEFNNENMIFYNNMYQYFSFFVHPDIRIADYYLKDGYLSHNNNGSQNVIFYYIHYVNVILLYDLVKLGLFKKQNEADIKFFTKEICKLLLMLEKSNKSFIHSRLSKMLKSKLLKV
jgi:hypothetical protein